jgi:signal transduction histidine kinase
VLEENVNRISTFVKEFLQFARGGETRVVMVHPNEPLQQVVEMFRDKAQRAGIQLNVDLQDGIAPAPLDEEGIHTCMANLVSNAIDACLLSDLQREYVVTVSSREEDGTLVYEVVDNGHGMDYEISRKVFSKFFSTKGLDRGTGLGLLTTKKIVHQHGGRISFESREGEGSVFRIELSREALPKPCTPAQPPQPAVEEDARARKAMP